MTWCPSDVDTRVYSKICESGHHDQCHWSVIRGSAIIIVQANSSSMVLYRSILRICHVYVWLRNCSRHGPFDRTRPPANVIGSDRITINSIHTNVPHVPDGILYRSRCRERLYVGLRTSRRTIGKWNQWRIHHWAMPPLLKIYFSFVCYGPIAKPWSIYLSYLIFQTGNVNRVTTGLQQAYTFIYMVLELYDVDNHAIQTYVCNDMPTRFWTKYWHSLIDNVPGDMICNYFIFYE